VNKLFVFALLIGLAACSKKKPEEGREPVQPATGAVVGSAAGTAAPPAAASGSAGSSAAPAEATGSGSAAAH
jgi:hypothetical protein